MDRQGQRSSMHARHLNEQLVRVLKTIGYDVGFQKGQGQYLFDRDGVRYLDLLSGFGVFAIGRNHPAAARGAQERARQRSAQSRPARCLDPRRRAGRAAAGIRARISTRCSSPIPAPNASRPRSSSPAAPPGARTSFIARHAFHGLTYGALSLNGRSELPRRLRAAVAGLHFDPFQRSRRAGAGAVVARCRRLHRRADPGQGRQHARPTNILPGAAALVPQIRHACSSPTKSRPASAAPAASSRSNIGTSSPTWCCSPRRCPAATCRSARC